MSLRNWGKYHTYGLIVGALLPLIFVPLVIQLMSWADHREFSVLWDRFWFSTRVMSKITSLAVIANMPIFYLFLNREKYEWAMGIILGSMIYVPFVIYFNFIR
jgi:hypothetical protein